MRRNSLRERLREDKPTLGTHMNMSDPTIVELIGHTGMFDYFEFVAEYGAYDLYALDNIGRAIDLFPNFSGMIKVEQEPRMHITVRAIGSGIQNILFADVRTVEQARQCVQSVRAECPGSNGLHGVGMRRDVGYILEGGSQAFVKALDEAVINLMIEKKECVENLEAILSVPGIDMVQFGPSDYAMSIGHPGTYQGGRHPAVVEAEKFTIETALKMGIRPRAEIGSPEQAKPYVDMGVRDFCIGWDVRILYDWFKSNGKAMREVLGVEPIDADEWRVGGQFRRPEPASVS
ncbi:MAG: 2,4-dihydroxyhept-2-ene-1,7-dioic acid aldolase [Chloroflexi bacterium]|nr:2,4-dihydroxyhept-2-ene-1,7-dioic acid aldolase [Chloroflexota bacterium]